MNNNIFFFDSNPFGTYGENDRHIKRCGALPIVAQVLGIARIIFAVKLTEGDPAFSFKGEHIVRGTLEFLMVGPILLVIDALFDYLDRSKSSKLDTIKKSPSPLGPIAARRKNCSGKVFEKDFQEAQKKNEFEGAIFEISVEKFEEPSDPMEEIFGS